MNKRRRTLLTLLAAAPLLAACDEVRSRPDEHRRGDGWRERREHALHELDEQYRDGRISHDEYHERRRELEEREGDD